MKIDLLEFAKAELLLLLYMAPSLIALAYIIVRWGKKNLRKEQAEERTFEIQYCYLQFYAKDLGTPPEFVKGLFAEIAKNRLSQRKDYNEKLSILEAEFYSRIKKEEEVLA